MSELLNLKAAAALIAEQTVRSDELGRVTLNLARSIVDEADARTSTLESALVDALDLLEGCEAAPFWNGGNVNENDRYRIRISELRRVSEAKFSEATLQPFRDALARDSRIEAAGDGICGRCGLPMNSARYETYCVCTSDEQSAFMGAVHRGDI